MPYQKILLFVLALATGSFCHAKEHKLHVLNEEEISHYNVSVMGGISTYYIGGNESEPIFEISGAIRVLPSLEAGLEYGKAEEAHVLGADLNFFATPRFFVGIQIGIKTTDHDYFYFGPQLGYDFHLMPHLTLGPEVQSLASIAEESVIFEAMFSLKYHF